MNKMRNDHLGLKKKEQKAVDAGVINSRSISGRKELIIAVFLVFSLPVLLYLQTVTFGYTRFDDDKIIENQIPFLKDVQHIPRAFVTDAFNNGSSKFYRPLQTISYMVDIQLSGEKSTWMYHLTNVLLLGLIACSVFFLLQQFYIPVKLALLSSLLFCAHPLFISNIAWIPARGDLLLILFTLLSFWFFIKYLRGGKPIHLIGHLISFTLALFSKETAVFLPLLFILYYFLFTTGERNRKRNIFIVASYLIIGLFWFWIRTKAVGGLFTDNKLTDSFHSESFGLLPILRNIQTIPESLSSFFIPVDIDLIPCFSLFKTFTGILIILLIGIFYFKNKTGSKKEKIFWMVWFILLLLPTMFYKHQRIDYLQHRFFLPLIGILCFLLFSLPENWIRKGNIKNSWIIIVIILLFSSVTIVQSRSFSDPMTYYDAAIKQNTASSFIYNNRGFMLAEQGNYPKAIEDYNNAIQLKPDFAQAYYNRGLAYFFQHSFDKAVVDFTSALHLEPGYVDAYNNRGIAFINQGLLDKALADFTKAIEIKPDNAMTFSNRGAILLDKGLYDMAIEDCTKAIELQPTSAIAYSIRGESYQSKGIFDRAISDYSQAIAIKPTMADVYNHRGLVYLNVGLTDNACKDFKMAAKLGHSGAKVNLDKFCH